MGIGNYTTDRRTHMQHPVKTKIYNTVSLDEAKRHLRIDEDWDKDNDYVRQLIYVATESVEQYIGKDVALTSNALSLWNFVDDEFYIEEGNVISIDSVVTDSSTSISVSMNDIGYSRTYVELSTNVTSDPLYVTYTTGFNDGECPYPIKHAILIRIGDLYDMERASYAPGVFKETKAWQRLVESYKLITY